MRGMPATKVEQIVPGLWQVVTFKFGYVFRITVTMFPKYSAWFAVPNKPDSAIFPKGECFSFDIDRKYPLPKNLKCGDEITIIEVIYPFSEAIEKRIERATPMETLHARKEVGI